VTTLRLEAFSDGVIAIIITIMVLELRVPEHSDDWSALRPLVPVFLAYVLSFVFIGIYWNNHHHLLNITEQVDGRIMWANLHLLFWLSLVPFVTSWMGQNDFTSIPTAAYGVVLLMLALAFTLLQQMIISRHGPNSKIAHAMQDNMKGRLSIALYAIGIPLAFVKPLFAGACYVAVALMWLVPDRRIEKEVGV